MSKDQLVWLWGEKSSNSDKNPQSCLILNPSLVVEQSEITKKRKHTRRVQIPCGHQIIPLIKGFGFYRMSEISKIKSQAVQQSGNRLRKMNSQQWHINLQVKVKKIKSSLPIMWPNTFETDQLSLSEKVIINENSRENIKKIRIWVWLTNQCQILILCQIFTNKA